MTPGQARVALSGFILLAAGVTSNALYLQGGVEGIDRAVAAPSRVDPPRRPRTPNAATAPRTSKAATVAKAAKASAYTSSTAPDRQPAATGERSVAAARAVKVRTVRVATFAEVPAEEADAETVRSVQVELNRRGYGPVPTDGVVRPPTRAAIMAFEQDHRLALTGEATQTLLKRLLFGTPAAAKATGLPEVRSHHAEALVRQVQRLLTARGYRPGAVDGRLGGETVAAIRTFETDQGLVPKGRISVAVLKRLKVGIGGGGRHPTP